jgi:hypothetical protein
VLTDIETFGTKDYFAVDSVQSNSERLFLSEFD